MPIRDLCPELDALVGASTSDEDFLPRFTGWLERQRSGALGPLLDDMTRHWRAQLAPPPLHEARAALTGALARGATGRARAVLERHAAVTGHAAYCEVVLLAGLGRPEGYSRFDRGRNTVFIGLDHPESQRADDHFEIVLAHELCHAVRDPALEVLRDYGGDPGMSHDDFVARHPFREHLVSEGLAGALSELAYPGRAEHRYVYMSAVELAWCADHRREIAARIVQALERAEPYRTFYAAGAVAPGSPGGCDYWFGHLLARFALGRSEPRELLVQPASRFLDAHLEPFLARLSAVNRPAPAAPKAPEHELLAAPVRTFYRRWLSGLRARPGMLRESEAQLARGLADARIDHGGLPIAARAFPLVLAREEERYLAWTSAGLMRVAEKVARLYRRDAAVRAFFGLPPAVEQLALRERRRGPAVPIARFDAHWNGRRVRFLELNTNGTAAFALADRLGPLWLATPAGRLACEAAELRPWPLVAALLAELDAAWRRSSRRVRRSRPRRIAIVDWREVPTRSEQELLRDALLEAGHEALLADPRELEYTGEALLAAGRPVDQVYRRLTLEDFLAPDPRLEPFLAAIRAGAVADAGSFVADVAHTKRLFAFLTHERWRHCFTMAERALIDAHVPWTRLVEPGPTLRGSAPRELRAIALAEREQLVLKPAEGHEGRDVLLGLEASPREWERELDRRMGRGHVLQEHVPAPVRTVFGPAGNGLSAEPRFFHLGLYVLGGRLAGLLARVSPERVLSHASDESALPAFALSS